MTMQRRRRGGGRRSARRKTQWVDTLIASTLTEASQTTFSLLGDLITYDTEHMTLVRSIVDLQFYPLLSTIEADESNIVDIGIGLASQDAFAASALPDPVTEADAPIKDWVWRHRESIINRANQFANLVHVLRDLKSSRVIGKGELYITFDNNSSQGGGFSVTVTGLIRCLFKLA